MVETWVSFWLWLFNGHSGGIALMLFSSSAIASICIVLSLFVFVKSINKNKINEYEPVTIFTILKAFLLVIMIINWFAVGLILGSNGIATYQENFKQCMQTENIAHIDDGVEASNLYRLHCRDRTNINDEWSKFDVVDVQHVPFVNVEFMQIID